ncbi:hypothetical protein U1Q18_013112 [Sarracenia purpurea var. burkii]
MISRTTVYSTPFAPSLISVAATRVGSRVASARRSSRAIRRTPSLSIALLALSLPVVPRRHCATPPHVLVACYPLFQLLPAPPLHTSPAVALRIQPQAPPPSAPRTTICSPDSPTCRSATNWGPPFTTPMGMVYSVQKNSV